MKQRHDINTYSKLAEGANFYLHESFHYINEALTTELASYIFSNQIEAINPTAKDRQIYENLDLPHNPVELLQADIPDVLTEETIGALSTAWSNAQTLSKNKSHNFGHDHTIKSIEMLGHLNNFGFFIEIIINRHLLFLKHSNLIDDFSYSRISIAKVMERMIFIFKDELKSNKIHLNEIVNLFSLRNKTVHYTPDNAMALNPKISEMIQIWKQTSKVLKKLEKIERVNEDKFSSILDKLIDSFKTRWT